MFKGKKKKSDAVAKVHFPSFFPSSSHLIVGAFSLMLHKVLILNYISSNDLPALAQRITQRWQLFLAGEQMVRTSLHYRKERENFLNFFTIQTWLFDQNGKGINTSDSWYAVINDYFKLIKMWLFESPLSVITYKPTIKRLKRTLGLCNVA